MKKPGQVNIKRDVMVCAKECKQSFELRPGLTSSLMVRRLDNSSVRPAEVSLTSLSTGSISSIKYNFCI
jgi:hypothetical protein